MPIIYKDELNGKSPYDKWNLPKKFNSLGEIRKVNGKTYQIIDKKVRDFSFLERLKRGCIGVALVVGSFGLAFFHKKTISYFTKKQETVRFAVLVDPSNYRENLKSTITDDTLLNDNTKNSSYIMSQIVKTQGLKIQLAGPNVKKDPEVILLALKQDISTLQFIDWKKARKAIEKMDKLHRTSYYNRAFRFYFDKGKKGDESYLDRAIETIEKMGKESRDNCYENTLTHCLRMIENNNKSYLDRAIKIIEKMDGKVGDNYSNLSFLCLKKAEDGDRSYLAVEKMNEGYYGLVFNFSFKKVKDGDKSYLEETYKALEKGNKKDSHYKYLDMFIFFYDKVRKGEKDYLKEIPKTIEKMDANYKNSHYSLTFDLCLNKLKDGDKSYLDEAINIIEKMDNNHKNEHYKSLFKSCLNKLKDGDRSYLDEATKIIGKIEDETLKKDLESELVK